jgi:hypothetical protein
LKKVILLTALLISPVIWAGGQPGGYRLSDDTLQKLYAELHYLNQVGREIHAKYDDKIEADLQQMRFCRGEYGYIGSRAKATIGIASRLDSPNREEYIATGWKAFDCIKCNGQVSSCDAIPPTLKTIKAEFKAQQSQ